MDNGKKLDLPPLNTLLPTSFDILPVNPNLSEQPVLLETSDDHEVWFMKDDKFKRPKGIVNLKFYTNDCETHKTPEGRVFFECWDICLQEFRREFCYMADLANLDFDHQKAPGSINFRWSGYNTSLPNFVKECLKIMNAFKSADFVEIFNDKKEQLLQRFKNHYLQQTFRLAWGEMSSLVHDYSLDYKQMKEVLVPYTYSQFKE